MFAARNMMFARTSGIEVTDFDGVDDYISIPPSGLFDVKSFRLEASFIVNDAGRGQVLVSSRRSGTSGGYSFAIQRKGNDDFSCFIGTAAGAYSASNVVTVSGSSYIEGDAVDLLVTYDGSTLSMTIDGVESTKALTTDMYLPTELVLVGAYNSASPSFLLDGSVYNLQIGTTSTVRGSWNNTTWEDQINSADGTIYGSPSIITINP